VLDCLAGLVPSTQLLLGTDYPMAQEIGVTSTLAGLARHRGFHDDDRRAIAADNARRLSHAWPPRPSAPRTIPQGQEASNAQAVHLRHKPTTARAAIRERASWR
jgi:hypothetical protein